MINCMMADLNIGFCHPLFFVNHSYLDDDDDHHHHQKTFIIFNHQDLLPALPLFLSPIPSFLSTTLILIIITIFTTKTIIIFNPQDLHPALPLFMSPFLFFFVDYSHLDHHHHHHDQNYHHLQSSGPPPSFAPLSVTISFLLLITIILMIIIITTKTNTIFNHQDLHPALPHQFPRARTSETSQKGIIVNYTAIYIVASLVPSILPFILPSLFSPISKTLKSQF